VGETKTSKKYSSRVAAKGDKIAAPAAVLEGCLVDQNMLSKKIFRTANPTNLNTQTRLNARSNHTAGGDLCGRILETTPQGKDLITLIH
jgi:hypothetical protein